MYYKIKPEFQGVYSRNNLPKTMKDGGRVINLDGYKSIGTLWIAFYANVNRMTYFDSFDVLSRFFRNNNIVTNISRMEAYDLIMCKYLSFGFIDFMFNEKRRNYYDILFLP